MVAPTKRTTAKKVPPPEDVLEAPTPVTGWKKSSEGILVRVPSGNIARIRTPGIEVFVTQGVIPNGLMPLIMDSMKRGGPPKDEDLAKMLTDEKAVQQIVELSSAITVYCCLDPIVLPVPEKDENGKEIGKRDPEALYVDEVDFNDRMYIFGVAVGGTSTLEQFHKQQATLMGSVPNFEAVGEAPE